MSEPTAEHSTADEREAERMEAAGAWFAHLRDVLARAVASGGGRT